MIEHFNQSGGFVRKETVNKYVYTDCVFKQKRAHNTPSIYMDGHTLVYQSKLPTANVPLRALEDRIQGGMYFLWGCARHASGKYDLVD